MLYGIDPTSGVISESIVVPRRDEKLPLRRADLAVDERSLVRRGTRHRSRLRRRRGDDTIDRGFRSTDPIPGSVAYGLGSTPGSTSRRCIDCHPDRSDERDRIAWIDANRRVTLEATLVDETGAWAMSFRRSATGQPAPGHRRPLADPPRHERSCSSYRATSLDRRPARRRTWYFLWPVEDSCGRAQKTLGSSRSIR